MLHRLRTGVLWRELPARFGDAEKVRWRRRTWLADGVWSKIVRLLDRNGTGTPVVSWEAVPEVAVRTALDAEAALGGQNVRDVVNPVKIS